MSDPIFRIWIGSSGVDSMVECNGKDITKYLRGVFVRCEASHMTRVTLMLTHDASVVQVEGAINDVGIETHESPEDGTQEGGA
jgi:hypothetical protein